MGRGTNLQRALVLLLVAVLSLVGCEQLGAPTTDVEPTDTAAPTTPEEPGPGNAAVAIAPRAGPEGTEVAVAVAGFPAEAQIELGVGRSEADYRVVESDRTDVAGSLAAVVPIPTTAVPGEEWVVIVASADEAVKAVSHAFSVTEVEYEPDVFVTPSEGPVGTEVAVIAHGFPPNVGVEVGVGRVDSEYDVVATAQTDGAGRMATQIAIPEFVDPAHRWVIAVAVVDRPIRAVSEELDVTPTATPTPVPTAVFTRTNIYLVAVGDDGQFGERFGCNDSLVKYEVAIEPTGAPLTAALERLLSIDSRQVGEIDLTNHPLYRSELEVESVEVVAGEAVIRLSGTLDIVGVCDEPRVWRQLSETALQFDTVDEVSIFIDDTPLDELLMMEIE